MNIINITPKFVENYDVGYIGFTYTAGSLISEGVAWFERWARMSDIKVSHVFVVTGDDQLVEAHIEHGVVAASIGKYFDDPKTQVFFRQPMRAGRRNSARGSPRRRNRRSARPTRRA